MFLCYQNENIGFISLDHITEQQVAQITAVAQCGSRRELRSHKLIAPSISVEVMLIKRLVILSELQRKE
jgi:hypothetical protein